MPLVPLSWLADFVEIPANETAADVAADLVAVGLEEESIIGPAVTGPLVVGRVLTMSPEPQKNGKVVNWCTVDVGPQRNEVLADGTHGRGIICGAHNFAVGDLVVVALPGTVLPGPFPIAARKTYGHVSDGMICSLRELGLGQDHDGIIVLPGLGFEASALHPGQDAIELLGLAESVVEVNVTPDRGYCFAIRGVAREYSHATGRTFTDPAAISVPVATDDGPQIRLADDTPIRGQRGCDRFVARVVRGVDAAGPSPSWMQRRLQLAGMRPISLAVDVTNYLMIELGQPMHAYDLAQVSGGITVRRAAAGERLRTLDDVLRELDREDLVIADDGTGPVASRVIGLAGVMGGAESEIGAETTDILIEAAHFSALSVARTARRHKVSSEASKRFERGVDPALPDVAVQRAVELLVEYGGGEPDLVVTDVDLREPTDPIEMDLGYPGTVVGVEYSSQTVVDVLTSIGCEVSVDGANASVVVPSWRPDLTGAIHLVEEVARLRGYDEIPSVLPTATPGAGRTPQREVAATVAGTLAESGLTEVLSYPFVSAQTNDDFDLPAGDRRRAMVRLLNPLSEEQPFFRSSLLQSLVDTVGRNVARGMNDLAVFELGVIAFSDGLMGHAPILPVHRRPTLDELDAVMSAVPEQHTHVAGVFTGSRIQPGWRGALRVADWVDAVAAATRVVERLGLRIETAAADVAPWHPGRCAAISVRGLDGATVAVGYAGELHPGVLERCGLPARACAFELDLDALASVAARRGPVRAVKVSTFPLAKEDIALVVPTEVPVGGLLDTVRSAAGPLAENIRVFDVYQGEQLGEGKKSVAFSLRLRAADRTLTAQDGVDVRAAVVASAAAVWGAELRA